MANCELAFWQVARKQEAKVNIKFATSRVIFFTAHSNTVILDWQLLEALFLGLWQQVVRPEGHEGGRGGRREESESGGRKQVELGGGANSVGKKLIKICLENGL